MKAVGTLSYLKYALELQRYRQIVWDNRRLRRRKSKHSCFEMGKLLCVFFSKSLCALEMLLIGECYVSTITDISSEKRPFSLLKIAQLEWLQHGNFFENCSRNDNACRHLPGMECCVENWVTISFFDVWSSKSVWKCCSAIKNRNQNAH